MALVDKKMKSFELNAFKPGEDETNKEVREISNLSKKGLFIAIQVEFDTF